jgi:hypothetical protein
VLCSSAIVATRFQVPDNALGVLPSGGRDQDGAVNAANERQFALVGAFVGEDRIGFLQQNPARGGSVPAAHHQRFLAATEIKPGHSLPHEQLKSRKHDLAVGLRGDGRTVR